MSAALDFQGDPAMTKAQSKLFVLQPVRHSGRARPPLPPALKKSTTRLREAATRDKGSSGSMRQSGALGAVGGGRPLRRPYFSSGFSQQVSDEKITGVFGARSCDFCPTRDWR